MNLDVQFNLKRDPNYIKFLRENSYWYKILTRDPNMFKEFVKEMKVKYKLRTIDKINNALTTVEMIEAIISTMK